MFPVEQVVVAASSPESVTVEFASQPPSMMRFPGAVKGEADGLVIVGAAGATVSRVQVIMASADDNELFWFV